LGRELNQPVLLEHFQRLTQRGAADPEFDDQLTFRRQLSTEFETPSIKDAVSLPATASARSYGYFFNFHHISVVCGQTN